MKKTIIVGRQAQTQDEFQCIQIYLLGVQYFAYMISLEKSINYMIDSILRAAFKTVRTLLCKLERALSKSRIISNFQPSKERLTLKSNVQL